MAIKTALGEIVVELFPNRAPLTVSNFLRYVDAGLFKETAFFRTVTMANQPDSPVKIEVIQGGEMPVEKEFPAVDHETTLSTGLRRSAVNAPPMPRRRPQATKVAPAPCQRPLRTKVTTMLNPSRTRPTRLPPNGM